MNSAPRGQVASEARGNLDGCLAKRKLEAAKFTWMRGMERVVDGDWAAAEEMLAAAAGKSRDPYMMNRSRVLADWGGFLEGGTDEDDFRFRRALAVRVGNGTGHAHADTLDLRLWAHGVTMSGDGVSKLLSVKFDEAVSVAK